jgi:hypothetical protein
MEQQALPDSGGRRSGMERRVLFADLPFESERRSGEDRRTGFDRRLKARFVTGAIKDLNSIKFEKPSKLGKIFTPKKKKNSPTN